MHAVRRPSTDSRFSIEGALLNASNISTSMTKLNQNQVTHGSL